MAKKIKIGRFYWHKYDHTVPGYAHLRNAIPRLVIVHSYRTPNHNRVRCRAIDGDVSSGFYVGCVIESLSRELTPAKLSYNPLHHLVK